MRYGYRTLNRQRLFAGDATTSPNADALAPGTFQIPVHPGLPEPTIEWMAERLACIATEGPLHH